MQTSERYSCRMIPNTETQRYAVYFSHGDRFEVIAKSETDARKKAVAQYGEWGGYYTRTVKLAYEEPEAPVTKRADRIRDLIISLHDESVDK